MKYCLSTVCTEALVVVQCHSHVTTEQVSSFSSLDKRFKWEWNHIVFSPVNHSQSGVTVINVPCETLRKTL